MLDLAILGCLIDEELHGYELTKRLADLFASGSSVSFGSVYPALSRMERAGHVKAVEAAGRPSAAIPMTGSLAGELAAARSRDPAAGASRKRTRKVYGITAKGEARLVELLTEPAGAASSAAFGLRLALFSHLAPEQRLAVIEQRRSVLSSRRDELQRTTPADRYQFARQTRELATIDYDLAWLANLARAEQAQITLGGNP
jgi:DNA-binding PadR family transcriptional regulator